MSRINFPLLSLLVILATPLASMAEPRREATIPLSNLDALRATFEQRGWRVEKAENGDLLVYPTAGKKAEKAATTATSPTPEKGPVGDKVTNLTDLEALARQRGWRVEKAENGDLLIYPTVGQNAGKAVGASTGSTPTKESVGDKVTNLTKLEALARQRGWRVEKAENGDLLVYPKHFLDSPSTPSPKTDDKAEKRPSAGDVE